MALTAYLKVEGKFQGEIKGDCPEGGDKKDKILVYAIDHSVENFRDTSYGRIHKSLTITKHKDQATPKLFKACCTGENVTVILDNYRVKPDGTEEKYFTTKLEEAIIVSIRDYTPLTFLPEDKPYRDMEEVAFSYTKITWTYNDGNIEFVDDLEA
ncbi:MAG: type VI secretion system tube protein Hcp [Deltaproteobacteria bacterium]|jgi:type VI secretion system secreted protein Hcp|nr:type VI secretion system tube protein Hcp [Deltaproteobacteria bacterium]